MKKIFTLFFLCIFILPLFAQNSGVTVVAPNGGENWLIGCPETIQWITATPVAVKIELFKNGTFYLTIANQVPATQNSYSWTPTYTVTPGNTYKVKVTCLNSSAGYDFSNANFSINTGAITVTTPNGGEVWLYGTTHLILWNDNLCENVRIELWKAGTLFSLLSASTPSTGSFAWAITNAIPAGNDYKIKIMSTLLNSGTTSMVFDFSDNNFTIGTSNNCVITVTSPNGGEAWARGTTHIITWQDNITYPVRIELWKGGVYHSLITASTPSTGAFYWAIPATIPSGNNYKVKILALNTNSSSYCYDFSDNNFSVVGSNSGGLKAAETDFNLYPNPCKDDLNIKVPREVGSGISIKIMNVTGKIMIDETIREDPGNQDIKINTTLIPDGFYILLIRQDQEIVYKKSIIVNH
jgi:hypothetical protein